jgi:hypothetical protein
LPDSSAAYNPILKPNEAIIPTNRGIATGKEEITRFAFETLFTGLMPPSNYL